MRLNPYAQFLMFGSLATVEVLGEGKIEGELAADVRRWGVPYNARDWMYGDLTARDSSRMSAAARELEERGLMLRVRIGSKRTTHIRFGVDFVAQAIIAVLSTGGEVDEGAIIAGMKQTTWADYIDRALVEDRVNGWAEIIEVAPIDPSFPTPCRGLVTTPDPRAEPDAGTETAGTDTPAA